VPNRATSDSVDAAHAAIYAAGRGQNAYAIAMLDFDYFVNRESRFASVPGTVLPPLFGMMIPPVPGFFENDIGKFDSRSISGLFETGYKFHFGASTVTPLAGVQFTYLWMSSFTETNSSGASTIGLSFPSRAIPSVPAYIGAQIDNKQYFAPDFSLYSWLRAQWVHEFETQRSIDPAFIVAPGFNFVIDGAQAATDFARIDIGGKLNVSKNVALSASFATDLYRTPSYTGWGGFTVKW
jgi:outer membrane autotransporter protein